MGFTEQQQNAVDSRNGSILVSAAAGSGKTTVLVQRIIERITDKSNPCPADSLLVVTFTKAAAGEMLERLNKKLTDMIAENPDDKYLIEQQMLLPMSKICTIDSFCNSLVKENFNVLGISPDFRIGDEKELKLMSETALNTTLEKRYKESTPEFLALAEFFFINRDDTKLAETIEKLYTYSRAYPFPSQWLRSLKQYYNPEIKISETVWYDTVIEKIKNIADNALILTEKCSEVLKDCPESWQGYSENLDRDHSLICRVLDKIKTGEWDEIR